MTTSPEVLVLRATEMQPGDVIVLQTEQAISATQAKALKDSFCDRIPWIKPGDVVVLAGAGLSVIRPSAE